MNLILLFEEDFTDANTVRLTGRRLRHMMEVHRVRTGDELLAGMANGRIGRAKVLSLNSNEAVLEVRPDREPPPALDLDLILALPRPPVLRRCLSAAAALGIKRICIVQTRRVEKSFWQSHALGKADVDEQLILGLEQAKDTIVPSVSFHKRFKPFVEDELPGMIKGRRAVAAHPEAPAFPRRGIKPPLTVFIGPEGGLLDYEVKKLREAGFEAFSLGERILRVETVLPYLAGRLLP